MIYRLLSPSYDSAVAELVRSNLKAHQLDIPGTVYFDDNLYHLSEFYNAMPDKRIYYVLTDKEKSEIKESIPGALEYICVDKESVNEIDKRIRTAQGTYVLFIDKDMRFVSKKMPLNMMKYLMQPDVCVTTPLIVDSNEKVIQGPLILGMSKCIDYSFKGVSKNNYGYGFRLWMPQNVSAIDYRCCMLKKDTYVKCGGLDTSLEIDMSVLKYCLLNSNGNMRAVYVPADLFKYTGKVKYLDFKDTVDVIKELAGGSLKDKYFNENLSLKYTDYIIK